MTPSERDDLGHRIEAAERRYRLTNRVTAMAIFGIAAYIGLDRLGVESVALLTGSIGLGLAGGWALSASLNRTWFNRSTEETGHG